MNQKDDNMKESSGCKPHLTAKEEEVMRILWEHSPLLVKEVLEFLPEPRPHVNTVSTVIRVLEKKGYVGHTKEVGTYRYHAVLEKTATENAPSWICFVIISTTILRAWFPPS